MHTKCVHTSDAQRRPQHHTRVLTSHCASHSTLHHATGRTPRHSGQQNRHGKQLTVAARSSRVSTEREEEQEGGTGRRRGLPVEALRGASAQCWPSPGADRAEPRSRLSNRRRLRVVPAGGRILRRRTRGGGSGRRPFLDFSACRRFGVFCILQSALSCFLQLFPSVLDFGVKNSSLGICLDCPPFPTFGRGFRHLQVTEM
jgi:hypothetical protein